jgi:hypothetical protein
LGFGPSFEGGAINNLDHPLLCPDNPEAPPFVQTFVDVLARCPHEAREFSLGKVKLLPRSSWPVSTMGIEYAKKGFSEPDWQSQQCQLDQVVVRLT